MAAGIWLGDGLVGLYAEHFRFPDLRYRASWPLVLGALGVSVGAAAAGALEAVRRAALLPPAEAMRPEEPARFSRGAVERLLPRGSLSPMGRIILRNLTQRPLRSAASVLGVGLSVSLVFVVLFFFDGFGYSFDLQFGHAQRQDLTVVFTAPREAAVRHDLAHLPASSASSSFGGCRPRSAPATARAG